MSYSVDARCEKEIKALGKEYRHLALDLKAFAQTRRAANNPELPDEFRRNFFNNKNATILHGSLKEPMRLIKARLYSTNLRDKSLRVRLNLDRNIQ